MAKVMKNSNLPAENAGHSVGEFTEIRVKRGGCPSSVVIVPEGIWVTDKTGNVMASVQMQGAQPVLAVGDHRKPVSGHQVALTVDENGEPYVQIAKGDQVKMLSFDALAKLAE